MKIEDNFISNLLCWYPFKTDKILELYYEQSCFIDNNVTSIKYEDYQQVNNIYDYLVLNNLPDYNQDFLNKIKHLLNKDGHILLIANNILALKYFAGAKKRNNNYLTISDIKNLIKEWGYQNYKFYYPYPEITQAFEIFTDTSINNVKPSAIDFPIDENRLSLFNKQDINTILMANNIAQFFADSFIIDISEDEVNNDIDYIKISNNRKQDYRIFTQIDYHNKKVYKKPLSLKAIEHLKNVSANSEKEALFSCIKYNYDNAVLSCDLLEYDNLKTLMLNENKRWDYLNKYKNILYQGSVHNQETDERFIEVFGDKKVQQDLLWVNNGNIDLLFDNIFVNEDKYILIDPEWFFEFEIPAQFILFKALANSGIEELTVFDDNLLKFIGINKDTLNIFRQWDEHFVFDYVGTKAIDYKGIIPVDLYEIYEKSIKGEDLQQIVNSKSWKLTEPLRMLADKIKDKR